MPDRIQRVPRGLNELLTLSGGKTPIELEERVQASLDLLQFYGLTQRRVVTAVNAAIGSAVSLPVALPGSWNLLYIASMTCVGNAAMTSLVIHVTLNGIKIASFEPPYLTAALGHSANFVAPYPLLLEPGAVLAGIAEFTGPPNASVNFQVLVSPIA
jgi:hypothetical protein